MKTTKINTDYGLLSVANRNGYYYAVRTVNGKKRQIYLGKSIPDKHTLNEVARIIFSSDREFWTNHSKPRATGKNTKFSSLREDLERIADIARARSEDHIYGELRKIIQKL
jgi:hypothetical protein